MTETALVSVSNVTRTYRTDGTEHPAVRGVSFDVAPGEFVALMGPSGCGKSTLLNMLGGIDQPDSGEVHVAGSRIDHLSETQLALFRRKHVGIVFQFFNLIHNLDVTANIELPALLAGMSPAQARTRSMELLDALDIAPLTAKMPGQLSGGQRQRVAIARALINRPTLLLADEPTGALDQEAGQSVLRLFRSLHAQGQTIVMVTHDPKVSGHAERILMMQDGVVAEELRPSSGGAASRLAQRLLGRKE